jgi:hypothetical protein
MKATKVFNLIFLTAVFLAACTSAPGETVQSSVPSPAGDSVETAVPAATPSTSQTDLQTGQLTAQTAWPDGQTRQDTQGQVEVAVIPLNLSNHDETLDFDVVMDTHSIDLSMDLAALATLSTDAGLTVNASAWSAPDGGHHVSGALQFPAVVDGGHILDNASRLILTIRDVDTPERTFTWDLSE